MTRAGCPSWCTKHEPWEDDPTRLLHSSGEFVQPSQIYAKAPLSVEILQADGSAPEVVVNGRCVAPTDAARFAVTLAAYADRAQSGVGQ